MKKLVILLVCGVLAVLAAVVAISAATGATQRVQGPQIKVRQSTSRNWSGYAVLTDTATPEDYVVAKVEGGWEVPEVTATVGNSYSSVWIGMDGYSNSTVEQIGTEQDWIPGRGAVYYAWYEFYPKPAWLVPLEIHAGDDITATVSFIAPPKGSQRTPGKFVLAITNTRTKQSHTVTERARAQRQSAEWIVEAPWFGGILPLADFGAVTFTDAYATFTTTAGEHRGPINDLSWQYDAITMVDADEHAVAQPSGLSAGGTSFTVTRLP